MKNFAFFLFSLLAFAGYSQDSDYAVVSYNDEGTKAPNTHYLGEAWLNRLTGEDDHLDYEIPKPPLRPILPLTGTSTLLPR